MEFLRRHIPRWVIFVIDIAICIFSLLLAYLLRFNFDIPANELDALLLWVLPVILGTRALGFILARTYAGIVRYTSTRDAERIFLVTLSGSILFILINLSTYYLGEGIFIIPFSIIILEFLITVFTMTFSRLLVKTLYFEYQNPARERAHVIIVGTDDFALTTKRTFDNDPGVKYEVVAFIDPIGRESGKKLDGIGIYSSDKLPNLFPKFGVTTLVFATLRITAGQKNTITDLCLSHSIKVLTVPEVSKWINGELSTRQIKEVRIEDLLGRDSIRLDSETISREIRGKVVMVTGSAGSIGREIVNQLAGFSPAKLILYDQAETPQHYLELDLEEIHGFNDFKLVLGDITNAERLEYIIQRYKPSVLFHAAAYKHVPMMEKNPAEAVLTNVLGTRIVADLAHKHQVDRFVMVSTDKAVNPTNVMGASKRIAEIYIQALSKSSNTKFITTRFGNVLGSSGSVIPRFRAQIEAGGPVTVTHPDITRYFMTIPEACQLVLEAAIMGKGGEIFIFDMGQSVKIADLAEKMIRLSGLEPGKDITIKYTGLRPGEKIFEELLNTKENTLPTYHPQIMIARVGEYGYEEIKNQTDQLLEIARKYDNYEIVRQMKAIVPEFKSQNSVYEKLDNPSI